MPNLHDLPVLAVDGQGFEVMDDMDRSIREKCPRLWAEGQIKVFFRQRLARLSEVGSIASPSPTEAAVDRVVKRWRQHR